MKRRLLYLDRIIIISVFFVIFLFILFPIIQSFYFTFIEEKDAFKVFSDLIVEHKKTIYNSILLACLTGIVSSIMSVFVGLSLSFSKGIYYRFLKAVMFIAMISPPFVMSLTYINLFGRNGFITKEILNLSFNPYGLMGVLIIQSLSYVPLSSLMIENACYNLNRDVIDASFDLGKSFFQTLRKIVLPLLWPSIKIVFILNFMKSISDFSTPQIIGGKFQTLASESYLYMVTEGSLLKACILNIIIFLPCIFIFYFYKKYNDSIPTNNYNKMSDLKISGNILRFVKTIGFVITFVILLEYLSLVLEAFTKGRIRDLNFTLEFFVESHMYLRYSFLRSIIYSLFASFISVFLSSVYVYAKRTINSAFIKKFDYISMLPFAIPGTFFGISYIYAFRSYPFYLTGTATIIIMNMLFKQFPLSVSSLEDGVNRMDMNLFDAVLDTGRDRIYILKDVIVPLNLRYIFLGFVNTFIKSMTTVGSIMFLVYPGTKLATITLFDVINSGKYHVGSVIALYIILFCTIISLICKYIFNRLEKKDE